MSSPKRKIRIFISSPGDVFQERIVAKKVIAELNQTYSNFAEIEALLWEDMPLLATASFQEGIDDIIKEYSIDIAVFILWSRLGSTLGKSYIKPDGTRYQSGTEYEFDLMVESFRTNGFPKIMAYIKDEPLKNRLMNEDDSTLPQVLQQFRDVQSFINEKFHDKETDSHYAYFNFGREVSFESRLKTHLKEIVREIIGSDVKPIKWEGIPYVGLNSYNIEQNEIFFGRNIASEEIIGSILRCIGEGESPSIIILGESGSGKSSLIQAGVYPTLSYIEGKDYYLNKYTPSSLGPYIYDTFVSKFIGHYSFLQDNPVSGELKNGIAKDYNFNHLSYALSKSELKSVPIFFFDQFEELFTDSSISQDQKDKFLVLLEGLVTSKQVFVVISMRSDFYHYFNLYETFGKIKQNVSLVYDIPSIGLLGYANIVQEPAKMVGVKWEINDQGIALDEVIINEASNLNALPLVQFALYKLYEDLGKNRIITYELYHSLGGIKGAFLAYINNLYDELSDEEKKAFYDILSHVITITNDESRTFVRKTCLMEECNSDELHSAVVKKLTNAHILVSGKNANGEPTITIIHEMLISSWPIIKDWIDSEEYFIKENNLYEQQAQQWIASEDKQSYLLKEDDSLMKAEYFHYCWKDNISSSVSKFIHQSFKYKRKLGVVRWGIYTLATLTLILLSLMSSDSVEGQSLLQKTWSFVETGLLLIPMITNMVICALNRPTYRTAKLTWRIWLVFLFLTVIMDGLDFYINPQDHLKNNSLTNAFLLIEYIIILLATFNAYQTYNIRKKWRRRIFKIPFLSKIFDFRKYRIFNTIISTISVVIFFFFMMMTYSYFMESNKVDVAIGSVDYMNSIFEAGKDEFNEGFMYNVNANRAVYLREMFPDSVNVKALPNPRKRELARTFYYRAMPDSALLFLSKDNSFDGLMLKSYCYFIMGEFESAFNSLPNISTIEKAIDKYPTCFYSDALSLISIYILSGNKSEAKHYLNKVFFGQDSNQDDNYLINLLKSYVQILNGPISASEAYQTYLNSYSNYYRECCQQGINPSDYTVYPISRFVMAGIIDAQDVEKLCDYRYTILNENLPINSFLSGKTNIQPNNIKGVWTASFSIENKSYKCTLDFKDKWMRYLLTRIVDDGTDDNIEYYAFPWKYDEYTQFVYFATPFLPFPITPSTNVQMIFYYSMKTPNTIHLLLSEDESIEFNKTS